MNNEVTNQYTEIEQKWQNIWYKNNIYAAKDNDQSREKKYILVEFPYPSGTNLHVGHCFRYTVPDVYSRFLRMKGYNVLFPIGWDAFGLPAEEYARKTGINPKITTEKNIETYRSVLKKMGYGFDWEREFATTDPEYYKWTQWMFAEFLKAGLAQQKEVELWWCEALSTVLANEEVIEINGQKVSERGEHPVEKKKMKQWVLKMPEYAEKLLSGLDQTRYPQHIKEMQRNWIGKSEGVVVDWKIKTNTFKAESIVNQAKTRVLNDEYTSLKSEKHERIYAGIVIINSQSQILLIKRAKHVEGGGLWDIPGGQVAEDEDIIESVTTSVFNEAGIHVYNPQFLGRYEINPQNREDCHSYVFYEQVDQLPKLDIEHDEYRWVSYQECMMLMWSDDTKQLITKLYNNLFDAYSERLEEINFEIPFGERGLAIIKVKETGEFVVYDKAVRNDFRIRFPGGHVDPGENSLQAAIRETEEEVGITGMEYIGYIQSSHSFYDWGHERGRIIHKLDHVHYFECTKKQWENRKPGMEKNISAFLATEEYIRQHATSLTLSCLEKLDALKQQHESQVIHTFTTRVDTIYSVSFLILAPEHPLVSQISTPQQKNDIQTYLNRTKSRSELERQMSKEKTGVFTGRFATNPLTSESIPIWVSDFVLPNYGTGAVMADAHDERDYELALKYNIPLKETIGKEYGEPNPNESFVEGVGLTVFDPIEQKYALLKVKNVERYFLVGGGIKEGETIEQTAQRELREGTGLEDINKVIISPRRYYSHYFNFQKNMYRAALTHPVTVVLSSPAIQETEFEQYEDFELLWLTPLEIINLIDIKNNQHMIDFFKYSVRELILQGIDTSSVLDDFPLQIVTEDGVLYNSGEFSNMRSEAARTEIATKLANLGLGRKQTSYKFRDWVFSRQRYWGEPFPIEYIRIEDEYENQIPADYDNLDSA